MAGIPAWAKNFAASVGDCFAGGFVGLEYTYSGPGEQSHDDHLFLFGPQPLEISGGPDNGAEVFEFLSVNIQAVQQVFTKLEETSYHAASGYDWYLRRHVALSGRVGKRNVTVYIFDEPLDDAESKTVYDMNRNTFRSKPPAESDS